MPVEFPPRQSVLAEEIGVSSGNSQAGQYVSRHWLDWFTSIAKILSKLYMGNGDPNGVVGASVGSLYLRLDGGAGTTLYVKEAGTGVAGWVGK